MTAASTLVPALGFTAAGTAALAVLVAGVLLWLGLLLSSALDGRWPVPPRIRASPSCAPSPCAASSRTRRPIRQPRSGELSPCLLQMLPASFRRPRNSSPSTAAAARRSSSSPRSGRRRRRGGLSVRGGEERRAAAAGRPAAVRDQPGGADRGRLRHGGRGQPAVRRGHLDRQPRAAVQAGGQHDAGPAAAAVVRGHTAVRRWAGRCADRRRRQAASQELATVAPVAVFARRSRRPSMTDVAGRPPALVGGRCPRCAA